VCPQHAHDHKLTSASAAAQSRQCTVRAAQAAIVGSCAVAQMEENTCMSFDTCVHWCVFHVKVCELVCLCVRICACLCKHHIPERSHSKTVRLAFTATIFLANQGEPAANARAKLGLSIGRVSNLCTCSRKPKTACTSKRCAKKQKSEQLHQEKEPKYVGGETPPSSIKEKEKHWSKVPHVYPHQVNEGREASLENPTSGFHVR